MKKNIFKQVMTCILVSILVTSISIKSEAASNNRIYRNITIAKIAELGKTETIEVNSGYVELWKVDSSDEMALNENASKYLLSAINADKLAVKSDKITLQYLTDLAAVMTDIKNNTDIWQGYAQIVTSNGNIEAYVYAGVIKENVMTAYIVDLNEEVIYATNMETNVMTLKEFSKAYSTVASKSSIGSGGSSSSSNGDSNTNNPPVNRPDLPPSNSNNSTGGITNDPAPGGGLIGGVTPPQISATPSAPNDMISPTE